AEVRRGLIHLRQQEILDELKEWPKRWDDVKPPEDPAMWEVGLAKVNDPGSTAMAESIGQLASVAARVVGAALPPTVPRVVGPLQSIAGWLGRHLAAPVRHPSGPGSMSERWKPWRDTLGLAFGAAAVGLLAAALVWAVADSQVSLAIGVGVGLLLAVAPAAAFALVAVTTEINPNEGKRRRTKAITVACWFGSFVSAVGAAVLTVVSMRLGWGALLVIAGVVLVVVVVAPVRRRW
ncbi:MAG: hypothetical protein KDA94_03845, partial [Acidimicrobiales bacterium]|nr:hypothetical protein [Acidimicrobiales bacterium]